MPAGPATAGPTLFCIRASIFLSTQSQNNVNKSMNVKPGKTSTRKMKYKSSAILLLPVSARETGV